jgi:hypothetical protein
VWILPFQVRRSPRLFFLVDPSTLTATSAPWQHLVGWSEYTGLIIARSVAEWSADGLCRSSLVLTWGISSVESNKTRAPAFPIPNRRAGSNLEQQLASFTRQSPGHYCALYSCISPSELTHLHPGSLPYEVIFPIEFFQNRISWTFGMRVLPPTKITSSIFDASYPASLNAASQGFKHLSNK